MVGARAKVIFSGCSIEASRVHTMPATTTAIGPLGQAVANQKAVGIATASAARIPARAAAIGSDQRQPAGLGSATLIFPSKATPASQPHSGTGDRSPIGRA